MRNMVGWYDPAQLLRTGIEVVVSTLFGKHSDSRRLDAVACAPPLIDYREAGSIEDDGSFGFDYVADTGDGWNSTYAVAYALSQPFWEAPNQTPLPRGKLLIFGGDLVYPYPTRDLYDDRLVGPYTVAGQLHIDEPLDVLAIPGNHDWYDSLVGFRRLFCNRELFGFRYTRQTRSYFAACLPGDWWLFAVDIQLDGELDELQFQFFKGILDKMGEHERVVLCIAEPVWLDRWDKAKETEIRPRSHTLLEKLEYQIGEKLWICVAGDLHHYQRHSTDSGRHRVTCGTGGAFLHPTHALPSDPTGEFTHKKSFPDKDRSRKLAFWNLRFITRNPRFGIVPGIAYLLAAWQNGLAVGECFGHVCIEEMGYMGISEWLDVMYAGVHSAMLSPIGIALYGLIFWGFVFFADKRSPTFRYTIGALHAAAHVVAGFFIYWFAVYVAITLAELDPKSIEQYLLAGVIIFMLSWIFGSIILGAYLLISLNVFGMHRNEAFSALRIQDWKGFLRFRIDRDGGLHMRFIGLENVPREWATVSLEGGRKIVKPAPGSPLVGEVIDQIDIPGNLPSSHKP